MPGKRPKEQNSPTENTLKAMKTKETAPVRKVITIIMAVITFIVITGIFVGLFNGKNAPSGNVLIPPMLCLALPCLIIADIFLIVFWAFRKSLLFIAPAITALFCIDYIGTLYQFGNACNQKADITIASYNVSRFQNENSKQRAYAIFDNLKKSGVDIICLQEYNDEKDEHGNGIEKILLSEYPYTAMGRDDMIIFSKFPITAFDLINFGETNNSALWADIEVDKKIIRVYNVHMQTTGINSVLHEISRGRLCGSQKEEAILNSYESGVKQRASQSLMVASHLSKCNSSIILCGDFNDVPYSYTYRTLLGNLVDGFRNAGKGYMSTYRGAKSLLRIDYIFHSKDIKGVEYVSKNWTYSDHYPVIMKLATCPSDSEAQRMKK